ncbi:hypothetical protein FE697_009520 [Mumia zhuanghuii]|uniref:YhjD/YihY/BrkB family envelope integrity protein n=2 Tax=Mumia TaxID=1546255 RepID=A0ABW1QQH4_9ACTN|nr:MULTISPECIES: YhjD/YihY/BrkB family envelope integrity protein [Mumia]KAA1423792.1 hypothetical protein FE697_009520 [Mumia zhuanghuii]
MAAADRIERWRARFVTARDWFERSFPGRCMRRMYEIDGRNRAITLAGQAFIALIPLLVVVSGWLSRDGNAQAADILIEYFDLTGSTAEAVEALFASPPDATGGLTLLGFLILLFSVGSFSRSLQRLYELAWQRAPAPRVRAAVSGIGGLAFMLGTFVLVGWVGHLLGPAGIVIQLLLSVPLWVVLIRIELGGRADLEDLLPAAVLTTIVQLVAGWWSHLYVPHLIAIDAQRYGVIGVAFAIVAWLVIVAYVLVGTAVVGYELSVWMRDRGLTARLLATAGRAVPGRLRQDEP